MAGAARAVSTPQAPPAERLVWDEPTLRRFWDYYADRPQTYFSVAFGASLVRHFRAWLRPGLRVLDFGCGAGGLIDALLKAGLKAGGVEANASARMKVQAAYGNDPGFLGARSPDEADSFGPGFDVIFFVEVIEHLDDVALQTSLARLRSLLAPDGVLVCTTPNDEDIEAAMVFCPASGKVFHPMQHVRSWTATSLAARLSAGGFADVRTWTTDFGAEWRQFPRQWAVRAAKRLLRFPYKDPHLVAVARRAAD